MKFKLAVIAIILFCQPVFAGELLIDTSGLTEEALGHLDGCASGSRSALLATPHICDNDRGCIDKKLRFISKTTRNNFGISDFEGDATLVMLDESLEIQRLYLEKYGENKEITAFYDIPSKTIFMPSKGCSYSLLKHEISHAIINQYFEGKVTREIDEVLAKFAESLL